MKAILITLFFSFALFANLSHALPLTTSSRWIVNKQTGKRVKMACVNWPGHVDTMIVEGLNKRPVGHIATQVKEMGYNCVRLTYANDMLIQYANLTVAERFFFLELEDAVVGVAKHNPEIIPMTLVEAQKYVVDAITAAGLMVVLDNQVSYPMWCCGDGDGNGFWGDTTFSASEWLEGLHKVATLYRDTPLVVAMSLRNELRGPLQNTTLWYHFVKKGAETIHAANPDLLVLISGLNYDLDFTFLKEKPLDVTPDLKKQLVYEVHRYSFTEGQSIKWVSQPLNTFCDSVIQEIRNASAFLIEGENAAPLFVTEFGINQLGYNRADNMFSPCYMGFLAENDLDWSLWALQGSYYLRDNVHDFQEYYGLLESDWITLRSPQYQAQLNGIQQKFQDPTSKGPKYYILYHPLSGKFIKVGKGLTSPSVSEGQEFGRWTYGGTRSSIKLLGSSHCLKVNGKGLEVSLTYDCQSKFEWTSTAKLQLATKEANGAKLCLELDSNSKLVTNKCINEDEENPQSQWFKLILANVE